MTKKIRLAHDVAKFKNIWFKTIFGPIINTDSFDTNYVYSFFGADADKVIKACKGFYNLIQNRVWDTDDKASGYVNILDAPIWRSVPGTSDTYTFDSSEVYELMAYLCAKCQIYWDDTTHTEEELAYFKRTRFGDTLWKFGCFVSQEEIAFENDTESSSTSTSSSSSSASSNGPVNNSQGASTANTASKNSAGQTTGSVSSVSVNNQTIGSVNNQTASSSSASTATAKGKLLNRNNARGVNVSAGKVVFIEDMYWIVGEFIKPGKTKPRIHVSPLNSKTPLPVKFASGQGYDDCILFLATKPSADNFLAKCREAVRASTKLSSKINANTLELRRVKPDPNGYFGVATEFGAAYIKAKDLQESFTKLEEPEDPKVAACKKVKAAYEALMEFIN